jgi:hypothetical protein
MQQRFIVMTISPNFDLSAKCILYSIEFILEKIIIDLCIVLASDWNGQGFYYLIRL